VVGVLEGANARNVAKISREVCVPVHQLIEQMNSNVNKIHPIKEKAAG
jgi:hypothetical protein